MHHYQCYRVWAQPTQAERITNTLVWFPTTGYMPPHTPMEHIQLAANDLTEALLAPNLEPHAPPTMHAPIRDALAALALIFTNWANPPLMPPIPAHIAHLAPVPVPTLAPAALPRVVAPPVEHSIPAIPPSPRTLPQVITVPKAHLAPVLQPPLLPVPLPRVELPVLENMVAPHNILANPDPPMQPTVPPQLMPALRPPSLATRAAPSRSSGSSNGPNTCPSYQSAILLHLTARTRRKHCIMGPNMIPLPQKYLVTNMQPMSLLFHTSWPPPPITNC
jgi:hypothetical protein